MKLRDLTNKIVHPDGLWTQTEAERQTGIPQWKLSNFKNAADDSDYEKAWQDFLKLLKFCREHNIDPAENIPESAQELPPVAAEVINSVIQNDPSTRSDEKMQTGKIKKAGSRAISARGIRRHQRKHS